MAGQFSGTIDWDEYWETADETDSSDASPSATYTVKPLLEFFEKRGFPDSYADVGCGPGATVFEVAERYPNTSVYGYDAVAAVLEGNRERAREEGRANVAFEQATLPDFDPTQSFEVVTSFLTLCYVAEVEAALRALYDAVDEGGHLLLTYHNSLAQSMFQEMAEAPQEYLDEDGPWKPERFGERFELVLNGESLLSHREIHDILDTWPQSVWSVVESERYPAWRMNPLVFVPK